MSIHDLMQGLGAFQREIGIGLVAFPCVTYGLGALLWLGARPLARVFLAGAVCASLLSGVSMILLILYMLLFLRANLLRELHLVLHLLPVLSMLATLWLVSRLTRLDDLPGMGQLRRLIILTGISFVSLLVLHKIFIGIHFFASFERLLLLLAGMLVLWRWGVGQFFGKTKP
ncbi:MAG: hypothetical protein AB7N91_23050 [Candidatus Tectimicrobiota bacterium]